MIREARNSAVADMALLDYRARVIDRLRRALAVAEKAMEGVAHFAVKDDLACPETIHFIFPEIREALTEIAKIKAGEK